VAELAGQESFLVQMVVPHLLVPVPQGLGLIQRNAVVLEVVAVVV
jgi:hypothetical protein